MASQLARQFDPLGIVSPNLLEGKLILQRVATSGVFKRFETFESFETF